MVIHVHKPYKNLAYANTVRVFYRGKDITSRTFYLDTRRRIAKCFVHNDKGLPFLDPQTMEIVKETLYPVTFRHRSRRVSPMA